MMRRTQLSRICLRGLGITIPVIVITAPALGHFSILVPDNPATKPTQTVNFRFYRGHPYECEIQDTAAPESVVVISPDGGLRSSPQVRAGRMDNFIGGTATIQTFEFKPESRGDYLVSVRTKMAFDEHERAFVQDEVRLTLHCQTQNGWDRPTSAAIELVPLTRPYGLEPGFAFKAQALLHGKPLSGAMVEIEKLHSRPPKTLPEDDAMITRVVKTDVNGYVLATLDEPGWWCLCVTSEDGKKSEAGKEHPIRRRGLLWVYVDQKLDTPSE